MDADELFLGPNPKLLKKINSKYSAENCESYLKCNVDEVNQLLSIKRLMLEQPRFEKCVSLSEAEWDDNLKLAKVTKIAKNLTKNFSHSRNKSIYLYPEECLCLLEMKCLILKWNEQKMSIQHAYALLLATGNSCTFNQFRTYGYLVKLGFRVFKYDCELKNDNYDPKDLTKLPEISSKNKKNNVKNMKTYNKTDISCRDKNIVPFPKLESSGWVVISRQPPMYLPHNLQPDYDVYSFNITIKSNSTKITEMISFYETKDFKKMPFLPRENKVYKSPQPTGMYPVYEKNIPNTDKSDKNNLYEPQVKRFKQSKIEEESSQRIINMTAVSMNDKNNIQTSSSETKLSNKECDSFVDSKENYGDDEKDNLPIIINMETATLSEDNIVHSSNKINLRAKIPDDFNKEENMEIIEDNNTSIIINETASPLNDENTIFVSRNATSSSHQIHGSLIIEKNNHINEKSVEDSIPTFNSYNSETNSKEQESPTSNIILEDTALDIQLNVPNRIRQKLFAIKPTNVHDSSESVNDKHRIHYDVYYPDNEVPKTSRPAPDFRVIVFEEDLDSFPNVYSVNASNPNDNVPTLWAIVNSSSVSFYNVNNIVLPKSTDWDLTNKNNCN